MTTIKATKLRGMLTVAATFGRTVENSTYPYIEKVSQDRLPVSISCAEFRANTRSGHVRIRDCNLAGAYLSSTLRDLRIAIKGQSGAIELAGMRINGFAVVESKLPHPTTLEAITPSIVLNGSDFAAALNDVAFAMATEDARYYLRGALFECRNGNLRLVATDGHRLAARDTDFALAPEAVASWREHAGNPGFILRRESLLALLQLQSKFPASSIVMTADENRSTFKAQCSEGMEWEVTSRSVEGTYPDYQRVMPDDWNVAVDLDLAAINSDVQRAASMTDSYQKIAVFDPDRPRVGDVDVPSLGWEVPAVFGMNVVYLKDLAKVMPQATLKAFIDKDSDKPPHLSPVTDIYTLKPRDNSDLTVVQMPMRA